MSVSFVCNTITSRVERDIIGKTNVDYSLISQLSISPYIDNNNDHQHYLNIQQLHYLTNGMFTPVFVGARVQR